MEQESLQGLVKQIYDELTANGEITNHNRAEAQKLIDVKIYQDYGIEM